MTTRKLWIMNTLGITAVAIVFVGGYTWFRKCKHPPNERLTIS